MSDSRNDALSRLAAEFAWIRDLAPEGDAVAPVPASSQAQRAHILAEVGAKPLDWGIELGYRVAEQITREIPAYTRNEDGFERLRTGTESTTLQLLSVLAGEQVDSAVTPESLAAVTDFVQRRISLDDMMRGIQLGHGTMASAALAACARLSEPSETLVQVRALSERMFRFFDLFVSEMSAHYRAEQHRWAGSDTGVRLALVTGLLDETVPDEIAERKLAYTLREQHIAIVAVGPEADSEALATAVSGVLAAAHCGHRLVLPSAPGVVWAWGSPAAAERIAAVLSTSVLPVGAHAVTGAIAAGPQGFRQSHREALAAVTLLRQTPPPAHPVSYADVDLLTLLLADADRARAFTARELGFLAVDSPHARELRRTLAAFIDERGSPHAAAQRLSVSRNTVSYRVTRAEELLGRSVNVRRLQLRCALLVQEVVDAAASDEAPSPSRR